MFLPFFASLTPLSIACSRASCHYVASREHLATHETLPGFGSRSDACCKNSRAPLMVQLESSSFCQLVINTDAGHGVKVGGVSVIGKRDQGKKGSNVARIPVCFVAIAERVPLASSPPTPTPLMPAIMAALVPLSSAAVNGADTLFNTFFVSAWQPEQQGERGCRAVGPA